MPCVLLSIFHFHYRGYILQPIYLVGVCILLLHCFFPGVAVTWKYQYLSLSLRVCVCLCLCACVWQCDKGVRLCESVSSVFFLEYWVAMCLQKIVCLHMSKRQRERQARRPSQTSRFVANIKWFFFCISPHFLPVFTWCQFPLYAVCTTEGRNYVSKMWNIYKLALLFSFLKITHHHFPV